jgi:cytochrome c biogenesis factor
MILTLVTTIAIIGYKYRKRKFEEKTIQYDSIEKIFSEDNTFFAAIYTQLLILTVTLVLLLVRANGYLSPEVFETRLTPFVVILAAVFTTHTLKPFMDISKILIIIGLSTFFSIIYAYLSEGRSWMVGAMIPWAFVCSYSIFRYMWKYRTKKLLPMLRAWGPYTAHLGIMLILIGYCFSYGLGTENSVTLEEGERKLAGNFILELSEIEMKNSNSEITVVATIQLKEKDNEKIVVDDQISKNIQSLTNQETTEIYLKHDLHRDLYLTLNGVTPGVDGDPSSATITVREIPGIILVWIGSFLTVLGMVMTMFTEWKTGKEWLRKLAN